MNTGLLLKKIGESAYSRYRRFLIANHGSYKTATQIRRALLQEKWIENSSTLDKLSTPEIAKKFEREKILSLGLNASFPNGSISANFKPIRHCQRCTEICYHSNLFELPWIMKCPYHGIPITAKCSKCENELPPSSSLLAVLCPSCGTRISIKHINNICRDIDGNAYEIFGELENISDINRSLFPIINFVDRNQFMLNRRHANVNSSFYPSVLEIYDKSFRSLDKMISKGIIHCFDVGIEDYDLNIEEFGLKPDADFSLKFDVTAKVTNRIKNFLTNRKGQSHGPGDCFRHQDKDVAENLSLANYFSDNQWESEFCTACKIFGVWNNLIPFPIRDDLSCYINQKRVINLIEKVRSQLAQSELQLPEVVRYINLDKHRENPIRIPIRMTEKIFELDLWCTFIYLFHILSAIDIAYSEDKKGISTIVDHITSFNFKSSLCFCPYYIKVTENIWSLNYPKILDKDIVDSKLIKFLSL